MPSHGSSYLMKGDGAEKNLLVWCARKSFVVIFCSPRLQPVNIYQRYTVAKRAVVFFHFKSNFVFVAPPLSPGVPHHTLPPSLLLHDGEV